MHIDVVLGFYELKSGGYKPYFIIFELEGGKSVEKPFNFTEIIQSKEKAIEIARMHAIDELSKAYPPGIEYSIREE